MSSAQTEVGDKHNPFGGLGAGYYSDNTKGCYDVVDNAKPMMMEACRAVLDARKARDAATKGESFVISDYGTADAGTSMPLMHELVGLIRSVEPDTPIVLQYEDQPQNDWTSVFRRVQGEIESRGGVGEDAKKTGSRLGIMDRFPLVTSVGTGVSFYKTCFPRASVDLMFCSTAFHWLRMVPTEMDTVLHSAMAEEGTPEHAAYEKAAHEDWQVILSKRAEELKSGGRFGTVSFAKNDQGHFLGKSSHVRQSMHHRFCGIWQDFVAQGIITQAEFKSTNFPNQYRTMEETLRPFGGAAGPSTATSSPVIRAADGGLTVCNSSWRCLHPQCETRSALHSLLSCQEACSLFAAQNPFSQSSRSANLIRCIL